MTLAERMIAYRAKHRLTQRQLDILLDEHVGTVWRVESGYYKTHKANAARMDMKLRELEERDK